MIIKHCLTHSRLRSNKGLAIKGSSFYKITMTTDIKICPRCDAEFFAHISECNGCDVPLINPGEVPVTGAGVPTAPAAREDNLLVTIEQGDIAKIAELHNVLNSREIPSELINATAVASSCNGGFMLQVPGYLKETAIAAINEHWHKLHPELKDGVKREASGECPACGFTLETASPECPDCGLNLGGPDDNCSEPSSSCGPC